MMEQFLQRLTYWTAMLTSPDVTSETMAAVRLEMFLMYTAMLCGDSPLPTDRAALSGIAAAKAELAKKLVEEVCGATTWGFGNETPEGN